MRSFACTLLLTLSLSGTLLADGVIRNGLGARVAGRGGTNIAFADSGMILHDNPAGMINVGSHGLAELTGDLLITDIRYQEPGQFASSDHDPVPLGNVALIHKTADDQLAVGLGFFSPGGFATDYTMNGPAPFTGPQKYKSFGSLARALAGAAWQVDDRLSVGASLGVGISHIELEGPYFLQGPSLPPGTPTMMDLQATGAALSWSLGLQYAWTDATTIGVAYQGDTNFNLDGSTSTTVPGLGSSSFDTTLNMRWPMSLGVGLKHQLCRHRVIGVDAIWYDWSSAFDTAGMELSNPSSPIYQQVLGNRFTENYPLWWRDSISLRLGGEHHFDTGQIVRAGYVYHRNPIPTATLTPYLNTTLEHTFALGYGQPLWGGWQTDLAYQFMYGPKNTIEDSSLAGDDFTGGVNYTYAHFIYVGFLRQF